MHARMRACVRACALRACILLYPEIITSKTDVQTELPFIVIIISQLNYHII